MMITLAMVMMMLMIMMTIVGDRLQTIVAPNSDGDNPFLDVECASSPQRIIGKAIICRKSLAFSSGQG